MSEPDLAEEIDTTKRSQHNNTSEALPCSSSRCVLTKATTGNSCRQMVEVTRAYTLLGKPKVIYCRKQQQLG